MPRQKILVIDDTPAIHDDIKKVLSCTDVHDPLAALERDLFGDEPESPDEDRGYAIDSAYQGKEGVALAQQARADGVPYSLAFVDMRMPPGMDGLATIESLWEIDPEVQTVICSAYSDHSWEDIQARLGPSDRLLILKKPFDSAEILQLAKAMTTKWESERALQRHIGELDRLVELRTKSLQETNAKLIEEMMERERIEAELRVAQRLEAMGRLAAGLAHEINTPIQYASDSVFFIEEAVEHLLQVRSAETPVSVDQDTESFMVDNLPDAIGRARRGLERVTSIVKSMKTFSHPGEDRGAFHDLNVIIQNALEVTRHSYKSLATLECELGDVPDVPVHPGEIGQVLLNLIVNAADAIEEKGVGRGVIGIKSSQREEMAVIEVSDNGCGIPPYARERVFDHFFTTKEVGKGTGQGLAMAERIISGHGGRIEFESEQGVGTVFRFSLPLGNPGGAAREGI